MVALLKRGLENSAVTVISLTLASGLFFNAIRGNEYGCLKGEEVEGKLKQRTGKEAENVWNTFGLITQKRPLNSVRRNMVSGSFFDGLSFALLELTPNH